VELSPPPSANGSERSCDLVSMKLVSISPREVPAAGAGMGGQATAKRRTSTIYGPDFHPAKEFAGHVCESILKGVRMIRARVSDAVHGRSTIMETALPPPRQSVASPRFAPRSFIA
jgi:hypothetical protein